MRDHQKWKPIDDNGYTWRLGPYVMHQTDPGNWYLTVDLPARRYSKPAEGDIFCTSSMKLAAGSKTDCRQAAARHSTCVAARFGETRPSAEDGLVDWWSNLAEWIHRQ